MTRSDLSSIQRSGTKFEIRGRRYSIISERKPMTLLEQVAKLLTWRWKDVFAFRDDAGHLIATAEKSALNTFLLHREGVTFSIRSRRKGCLEVCRQRDGAAIGEVEYRGLIASELVSLPPGMGAVHAGFCDVDAAVLRPARTPCGQQLARTRLVLACTRRERASTFQVSQPQPGNQFT